MAEDKKTPAAELDDYVDSDYSDSDSADYDYDTDLDLNDTAYTQMSPIQSDTKTNSTTSAAIGLVSDSEDNILEHSDHTDEGQSEDSSAENPDDADKFDLLTNIHSEEPVVKNKRGDEATAKESRMNKFDPLTYRISAFLGAIDSSIKKHDRLAASSELTVTDKAIATNKSHVDSSTNIKRTSVIKPLSKSTELKLELADIDVSDIVVPKDPLYVDLTDKGLVNILKSNNKQVVTAVAHSERVKPLEKQTSTDVNHSHHIKSDTKPITKHSYQVKSQTKEALTEIEHSSLIRSHSKSVENRPNDNVKPPLPVRKQSDASDDTVDQSSLVHEPIILTFSRHEKTTTNIKRTHALDIHDDEDVTKNKIPRLTVGENWKVKQEDGFGVPVITPGSSVSSGLSLSPELVVPSTKTLDKGSESTTSQPSQHRTTPEVLRPDKASTVENPPLCVDTAYIFLEGGGAFKENYMYAIRNRYGKVCKMLFRNGKLHEVAAKEEKDKTLTGTGLNASPAKLVVLSGGNTFEENHLYTIRGKTGDEVMLFQNGQLQQIINMSIYKPYKPYSDKPPRPEDVFVENNKALEHGRIYCLKYSNGQQFLKFENGRFIIKQTVNKQQKQQPQQKNDTGCGDAGDVSSQVTSSPMSPISTHVPVSLEDRHLLLNRCDYIIKDSDNREEVIVYRRGGFQNVSAHKTDSSSTSLLATLQVGHLYKIKSLAFHDTQFLMVYQNGQLESIIKIHTHTSRQYSEKPPAPDEVTVESGKKLQEGRYYILSYSHDRMQIMKYENCKFKVKYLLPNQANTSTKIQTSCNKPSKDSKCSAGPASQTKVTQQQQQSLGQQQTKQQEEKQQKSAQPQHKEKLMKPLLLQYNEAQQIVREDITKRHQQLQQERKEDLQKLIEHRKEKEQQIKQKWNGFQQKILIKRAQLQLRQHRNKMKQHLSETTKSDIVTGDMLSRGSACLAERDILCCVCNKFQKQNYAWTCGQCKRDVYCSLLCQQRGRTEDKPTHMCVSTSHVTTATTILPTGVSTLSTAASTTVSATASNIPVLISQLTSNTTGTASTATFTFPSTVTPTDTQIGPAAVSSLEADVDHVMEIFPDINRSYVVKLLTVARANKGHHSQPAVEYVVNKLFDNPAFLAPKQHTSKPESAAKKPESKEEKTKLISSVFNLKPPVSSKGEVKKSASERPAVSAESSVKSELNVKRSTKDVTIVSSTSVSSSKDDVVTDGAKPEVSSTSLLTCEACSNKAGHQDIVQCCNDHLLCNKCVEKAAKDSLLGKTVGHVCCPVKSCTSSVPKSELKKTLHSMVLDLLEEKWIKETEEALLNMDDCVKCPMCSVPVILAEMQKRVTCFSCKQEYCRFCNQVWTSRPHELCMKTNTRKAADGTGEITVQVPAHWEPMPEKDEPFKLFDVSCLSQEFQEISTLFFSSFKKSSSRAVFKIQRIQNERQWEKYSLMRNHMVADLGEMHINERRLFHGTHDNVITSICTEGFDWRLCGKHGTAYGQGTYFAKTAAYSHSYSSTKIQPLGAFGFGGGPMPMPGHNFGFHASGQPSTSAFVPSLPQPFPGAGEPAGEPALYMFVGRVLAGRTCRGTPDMRRPTKDESDPQGRTCHSAVNDLHNPGIFVIFDSSQCYPEYLIKYKA